MYYIRYMKGENMKKYYVMLVAGGIDSELVGPYKNTVERNAMAKSLYNDDPECNAVFWLNTDTKGNVKVGSYSNIFMEN